MLIAPASISCPRSEANDRKLSNLNFSEIKVCNPCLFSHNKLALPNHSSSMPHNLNIASLASNYYLLTYTLLLSPEQHLFELSGNHSNKWGSPSVEHVKFHIG